MPTPGDLLPWLGTLPALLLARTGLHAAIRRSLAAPRRRETGTPGDYGLPWQAVTIPTVRQRCLHAWLIPAAPGAPALTLLHGWGGNAELLLPLALPLHRAGYALLLVDARNHGRSDGDDHSSLPRFAEDLLSAHDWLRAQSPPPSRLGLLGHSLGGAAVLLAAAQRSELSGVVSLAAFAHPADMMRRWLRSMHIPFHPLGRYLLRHVEHVIGYRYDEIAPCRQIARIGCPVLMLHGKDDRTVPPADAQRLWLARGDTDVRLHLLPGDHERCADPARQEALLLAFLAETLGPGRQA